VYSVRSVVNDYKKERGMIDSATLIRDNTGYLRQAMDLARQIPDDLYGNNDNPCFRSGVGRHLRHILGFYQCFLAGQDGKIDYDARNRDERVEADRDYAIRYRSIGKK